MEEEYIDEWELMYGNDMEAANELSSIQDELVANPAAQPITFSQPPPAAHARVEQAPEPAKPQPKPVVHEAEDYDMEDPHDEEREEGFVLRRPSLLTPSIACVLASGERVFIKKKEQMHASLRSKSTVDDKTVSWKLESSVKTLLENINKRAIEAVVEEDRQKELEEDDAAVIMPSDHDLWLNKYRPRHFIDLLSDERTNREVLLWLKSWDACVFPHKIKAATPASKFKGPMDSQPKKPADTRPDQKIILICGPPGAGKTTLAGIAARHAGYNPIEINASDDRTALVLKEKIISAMEMQSIFGDQRPNCIILDEIDGALSGQEGKGAISALQALVTAPYTPPSGKTKKTASSGHPLIRPIICIANDQFAPVLRPLRKLAKIFVMHTPEPRQLMQRLRYICKQEHVQASNSLLSTLCDRADNDVRFCLNALQFASARTPTLTLSMIDTMMGRKDVSKGAFDVWETVFYETKEQQKKSTGDAFGRIFEAADRFGSQDLILNGLHDNLLTLAFNDPTLAKINNALQWMEFADLVETRVRSHQQFALMPYGSVAAVAVHRACCTGSRRRIEYPRAHYEYRKQIETTRGVLDAFLEPGINLRLGARVLTLDVVPSIVAMLNPVLTSTPNDKEPMDRLVALMSSLHLSYKQVTMPGGVVEFSLEPALDMLVKFKQLEPRPRLPLGIRQTMAREVELENMRRADKSNNPRGADNDVDDSPAAILAAVVDVANPFGLKKRKREDHALAHAKRWPIRFKFNEGYTSGIKRPVLVQDLL
ncbi:Aste57867_15203 [Aphanomyces stellatus]|uniref:Aste57867_15203 protein n=1 Tax=Aphanomyces stellatus TaxID=120398 RepID=A0A485L2M2_9STRA|nr:hypothetical protein As57867_015147 [Aphanomyces stellatus]VFT92012.1 Aste57867_15203 [Aphanomyces stellatus]